MQALKILVVVMGVMIVAGTVTLVAVIVQRAGGTLGSAPRVDLSLDQPPGTRIAGIAALEGGAGLAVWVWREDGSDRVLLVDTRRGRLLGEIRAEAAPR